MGGSAEIETKTLRSGDAWCVVQPSPLEQLSLSGTAIGFSKFCSVPCSTHIKMNNTLPLLVIGRLSFLALCTQWGMGFIVHAVVKAVCGKKSNGIIIPKGRILPQILSFLTPPSNVPRSREQCPWKF
jgi:hypothetical protein